MANRPLENPDIQRNTHEHRSFIPIDAPPHDEEWPLIRIGQQPYHTDFNPEPESRPMSIEVMAVLCLLVALVVATAVAWMVE